MLRSVQLKCDVLMQYPSYDCEYFTATTWKTIDGVGFTPTFIAFNASLSKV